MDDDVRCICAFHDVARPGALLRRARPGKKRAFSAGAMSRHRGAGHHSLVGRWVTPSFFRADLPLSADSSLRFCAVSMRDRTLIIRYWVSQNVFAMYQLMFAIITPALIIGAVAERMKFAAVLVFVGSLDVRGLFPDRAHGVGNRWLDEWSLESAGKNYCDRFCRRNRRSHDLGLVGARAVRSSWTPARIKKGNHGAAQHGTLHGGNRFALGGMVRL